jgi:hypothetical protein
MWDLWWTKWHWDRFFSVSIIPPWLSILTSFGAQTIDVLVTAVQRHSPPIDMNMNISQLLLDSQEGVCLMELVIQIDNIHFKLLNVMIEWLTLLLCIQEIPGSNLGLESGYPDCGFSWLSSVPPGECQDSTLN